MKAHVFSEALDELRAKLGEMRCEPVEIDKAISALSEGAEIPGPPGPLMVVCDDKLVVVDMNDCWFDELQGPKIITPKSGLLMPGRA